MIALPVVLEELIVKYIKAYALQKKVSLTTYHLCKDIYSIVIMDKCVLFVYDIYHRLS